MEKTNESSTQTSQETQIRYINREYNENSSTTSDYERALLHAQQMKKSPTQAIANKVVMDYDSSKEKQTGFSQWIRVRKFEEDEGDKSLVNAEQTAEVSFVLSKDPAYILFWGLISQPKKASLDGLVRKIIEENQNANLIIHIGEHTFQCHLIALKAYSQFFRDYKFDSKEIVLPSDKITACGFHMLYNWLLADYPTIIREGIMELLQAAIYLEVQEIQAQCWQFFDDFTVINEHYAFFLYIEARRYNLVSVAEMMLKRISKFFLPLVASQDFLDLPFDDVKAILSSNYIGVNTEAEVFMAALFWMDYNWEGRQIHQYDLMECIRFSLLPPYFLVSFNKTNQNLCPQIQRCVANKDIKEMIDEALTESIWQLYDTDELKGDPDKRPPVKRTWVFDKACKYHDKRSCPNMSNVTYSAFCEYLDFLQTVDSSHYESFELASPVDDPDFLSQNS